MHSYRYTEMHIFKPILAVGDTHSAADALLYWMFKHIHTNRHTHCAK